MLSMLYTIIGSLALWLFPGRMLIALAEPIELLEPVGGVTSIEGDGEAFNAFLQYFNLLFPWAAGIAAGLVVLWALIGGVQIMTSGGDSGKRSEGIDKFKNALIGLLMLLFAGAILNAINPSFFKMG